MDPHRGLHRRLLNKRQGLGGVPSGFVPGGGLTPNTPGLGTTHPTTSQSTGNSLGPGGIVGGFTSLIGNAPSLVLPSSGSSSPTTPSTPLTNSSSSSTGSTPTSTSSLQTTTTSSTSSSTTSTSPTSTPTPTSTPSDDDEVYTSSDGTSIVVITSTLPAAPSPTNAQSTAFLQNPSMEGGVFALVGIVVLILIFILVTWTIRQRRRQRLEHDLAVAVNFDPSMTEQYERQEDSIEKHRLSGSSSGHGYGYGYGFAVQSAYAPPPPAQEYPVAVGFPTPVHRAPSPAPVPYPTPPLVPQQPAEQGGANLTRKFSDRKPVPPLLPNPTYDPSNGHVSIPPQFYSQ